MDGWHRLIRVQTPPFAMSWFIFMQRLPLLELFSTPIKMPQIPRKEQSITLSLHNKPNRHNHLTWFNSFRVVFKFFYPYICDTFIFISLGLVRLVSLMRKGWVVEPILLYYGAGSFLTVFFIALKTQMGTILLRIVPITRVNRSIPVCQITVIMAGNGCFWQPFARYPR